MATGTTNITGYGRIAKRQAAAKADDASFDGMTIKGFASLSGMDRQMDDIDPALFDIDSFMKNPQLYYDHGKWMRKDGNMVSAGVVEFVAPAYTTHSEDDSKLNIVDIRNGTLIETIAKDDRGIVDVGQSGLWCVCRVMEKEIADLIEQGRLTAFSWSGDLVTTSSGKSYIDLREISVVFIPANRDALFMVSKSADGADQASYFVAPVDGNWQELLELPKDTITQSASAPYALYHKKTDGEMRITYISDGTDVEKAEARAIAAFRQFPDIVHVMLLKSTNMADKYGSPIYEVVSGIARRASVEKKVWSTAYVNTLPDSSFAYIEPGGKKDEEGKTMPRSLRHFPIKDKNGKLDEAHVRNALARLSSSPFGDKARSKVEAAARALGIEVSKKAVGEDGLTDEERALLKAASGGEHGSEGGDSEMTQEELIAALSPLSDGVKALTERVAAMEAQKSAEAKAKADAEQAAAEQAAKAAEAAKKSEDVDLMKSALQEALTPLTDALKAVSERVDTLEKGTSQSSGQANEGGSDDESGSADPKSKGFSLEEKNALLDNVLNGIFVSERPSARGGSRQLQTPAIF